MMMDGKHAQVIFDYHQATKHNFNRFARSLGYLDWENQPNPFRFYEGTKKVRLPEATENSFIPYSQLYQFRKECRPFNLESLGDFLGLSLGLSAWKSTGQSSWPLRINPSSGNLHPTEAYLVTPLIDGVDAGIYHYVSYDHCLELRAQTPLTIWQDLDAHFGTQGFLIGLTSIFWRESWKYGERAFRYCNHDVGHALACLSFSANLQGWRSIYLNALSDQQISDLLGFHQIEWLPNEEEHTDLVCFVDVTDFRDDIPRDIPDSTVQTVAELEFRGIPNQLSKQHMEWHLIDEVSESVKKPETLSNTFTYEASSFRFPDSLPDLSATQIIQQRRSAVDMDGITSVSIDQFFCMLDKTMPRCHHSPFNVELGEPNVHLVLFVHRVDGMVPGVYFFVRNPRDLSELKALCKSNFLWKPLDNTFPLFLLKEVDCRREAVLVSCQQNIAGDGAFSLGMIARFKDTIQDSPYLYRHLFWETGQIGQVLYLEAEAHGIRSTGIGCFFDDPVHDMLGLSDSTYQSLYHFTVGGAIEDERLTTLAPYYHLDSLLES